MACATDRELVHHARSADAPVDRTSHTLPAGTTEATTAGESPKAETVPAGSLPSSPRVATAAEDPRRFALEHAARGMDAEPSRPRSTDATPCTTMDTLPHAPADSSAPPPTAHAAADTRRSTAATRAGRNAHARPTTPYTTDPVRARESATATAVYAAPTTTSVTPLCATTTRSGRSAPGRAVT